MGSLLSLLVANEYRTDIKTKSFWIGTLLLPIIFVGFGIIVGFLVDSSDAMKSINSATGPDEDITAEQAIGMMSGIMLVIFIMAYGAQIFNKVKTEKANRICEVLVSSIPGHTLMISKVISVALIGLTQILVWGIMIFTIVAIIFLIVPTSIPVSDIITAHNIGMLCIAMLYFTGGFLFYGSLFAACGALTDSNNENQTYMSIITITLMMSMYIGMFATDNPASTLSQICFYIPFTSPSVGGVLAISGEASWWQISLSIISLLVCGLFTISLAGKIYTSALLLKGKKFTPRDIITFLRTK